MTETVEIQQECANCGCNVSFFLPATDDTVELIERLRYRVDNYTAYYGHSDRNLDKLILAALSRPAAQEKK